MGDRAELFLLPAFTFRKSVECILRFPAGAPPKCLLASSPSDRVQSEPLFIRVMPALFVLLWSTGFLVSKLGAMYASPLTFLAWRYVLALALLAPMIWFARAAWPAAGAQMGHIAVAGILVHAGYLAGVWTAIGLGMSAGLSALIVGLQPVLTAFAGPWLGERVGVRQWTGLLLGLVGVALVVSNKLTFAGLSVASIALCVMALVSITAGTLYQKRLCPSFDLRTGTFVQYAASFTITLPFALAFEDGRMDWSLPLLFALGWSAIVLSFGAIFLLFLLIRRGAATRVVTLFYLTPPTTALMAWLLFGESLSAVAMLGMAVAVIGVALVVHKA
jgi:drug/metabolite transporter (DMT)-like permease